MKPTVWLILLCGCGAPPQVPCPDGGTALTYDNFGRDFLARHCDRCHSASAVDREGAPTEIHFDSRVETAHWGDRIYARAAAENVSMPPGPNDPPRAERDRLAEWLACGAP